jgi:hypothetical protein
MSNEIRFNPQASDISAATTGADANYVLIYTAESANATSRVYWYNTTESLTFSIDKDVNESYMWITQPNVPSNTSWPTSGALSFQLRFDSGSTDVDMRCRVLRLNSSGTAQDTGSYTSWQTYSGITLTFSPSWPTWGTQSATDRFAVQFEFDNTSTHGGVKSVEISCQGTISSFKSSGDVNIPAPVEGWDTVYYTTTTASDVSPFTDGNYELSLSSPSDSSVDIVLTTGQVKTFGFITPSGTPNNATWSSNTFWIELSANLTTLDQIDGTTVECRLVRVNDSGTVQESETYTSPMRVFSDIEVGHWLTTPDATWGSPSASDRLALEFRVENFDDATRTVSINVGTADARLWSPIVDNTVAGGTTIFQCGIF